MKKLLISIACFISMQAVMARKVTVTSSADNVNSPTVGMLRYHLENAQSDDTITFSVSSVKLEGQISLSFKSFVLDGTSMGHVTLDGQSKDRILNVSMYSSSSSVTLKNLKFVNGYRNSDYGYGGALYGFVSSGELNVDNCIFENNSVFSKYDAQGGAIRTNGGTFTNCTFIKNSSFGNQAQGGGAVQAVGGLFINCLFYMNESKYGGGVYASNGAEFYNCTFVRNVVTVEGGGIESEGATFVNCISYNNYVNTTISNIKDYSSTVKYCAFETGNALVGTDGNIGLSSSPFKGGSNADSLTLAQGSTCINAGTSVGITVLSTDLLSNKRVEGLAIDMGVYEFGSSPLTGLNVITSSEEAILYPNPSKGTVYLNSSVFNNSGYDVEVFDMSGNLILQQSNSKAEKFQLSNTGIYHVKIKTAHSSYVQKVIVQ